MKKFHLTDKYCLIHFGATSCDTEIKILSSKGFIFVLSQYMKTLRKNQDISIESFKHATTSQMIEIYKLLMIWDYSYVYKHYLHLRPILGQRDDLYRFTEDFYNYWRKLERIGILSGDKKLSKSYLSSTLISTAEIFNLTVLQLYRTITQNLLGDTFNVYRQLPAGINANIMITPYKFTNDPVYEKLQGIGFIQEILTRPPFMIYSKSNKREGLFEEIDHNILDSLYINKNEFVAYPIYVGKLLAFVYIHIDFLHHGIALSNLFETASDHVYEHRKPDLIYVYGMKETEGDRTYYKDLKNDYYIGFVSREDKNDYFGYMKKMLLTLHNVYMIDHGYLPIHGSMVKILLKSGDEKNIAVIGDSGAGKSETLEALRHIGDAYIKDMRVIFDDMGIFYLKDEQIYAQGTEIGAFVRLDDLDAGYAYREFDRAIFLNPDQSNARLILPVASYAFITADHKLDMLFYANNYIKTNEGLEFFANVEEAKDVFREGMRKAKGTTQEIGLVKSYFANPFGPVQQKAETEVLLNKYFNKLFENNVPVGILYTQLAVDGVTSDGPIIASTKLLEFLHNK
ncbi:MAG: hypothetical protein WCR19_02400 [Acholeplasmataceae bacterium]